MNSQDELVLHSFKLTVQDKELLKAITEAYAGASMSSIMRRLIRQEAHRLGLVPASAIVIEDAMEATA